MDGFAKVYIIYNTSIAHYVKAAMLVVFQQKNLIMLGIATGSRLRFGTASISG
jgi:hypothetical protein